MRIKLIGRGDFDEWRDAARELLLRGISPSDVKWCDTTTPDLFDEVLEPMPPSGADHVILVSPAFIELAQSMICHSDPLRFAIAYRLLWRLQSEPRLLEIATDAEVSYARRLVRNVGRDSHKMTAFVRFKEVPPQTERRAFVAWFEPDHFIVARTAPFFQRRFTDMDWLIATPKGSAKWDGKQLQYDSEPAIKPEIDDDMDELWRTYFANIFNPARLKVKMMQSEMPKKYWKNLPEAALIPDLIAGAEQRVRDMATKEASQTAPKFHDRLHSHKEKSSPVGTGEDQ